MANIVDATPRYVVIIIHDEYEQSVRFYIDREKALAEYCQWAEKNAEVYLSKIEEQTGA